jgi:SSS family solute:Na+ symporter
MLAKVAGIAQLFPAVVLGLDSGRVTTPGAFAGMAAGISVAMLLMLTGRDPYSGVNAGFIALCCNFAVTAAISSLTRVQGPGFDETVLPLLAHGQATSPADLSRTMGDSVSSAGLNLAAILIRSV